jgi:DNA primase
MAEKLAIGWAPRSPVAMRDALVEVGFDLDLQFAAGLLVRREDETEYRSRFRARLMIPFEIRDGEVMGFEGILITPGEPSFLYSPESEFFSRSTIVRRAFRDRHLASDTYNV